MNHKHLIYFLVLYIALFFSLFSGYRYCMDPDATGYLSVAEQLAAGHFTNAVNGIWSPLGSWLLAPFLRLNFNGILTAKYLNGAYGLLAVTALYYLVKKMELQFIVEVAIMSAAVLSVIHFSFSRLFGDLLLLPLLLLYLNIIRSPGFSKSYPPVIFAASAAAAGFYAKSYTLYFSLVHLPLAIFLAGNKNVKNRVLFKKMAVAVITLLLAVTPWMIALQAKYGGYILGRQNITGTLSPAYNQERVPFYEPPFAGAYSIFDDISYLKITHLTPFTNGKLFLYQLKVVLYNTVRLLEALNEFSFVFLLTLIAALLLFFAKSTVQQNPVRLLLTFILIWPCGLLLFHIESRFLWIMAPAVLVVSGKLMSYMALNRGTVSKTRLILFCALVAGSFCIYPLAGLKDKYGSGKRYFDIAAALKRSSIKGNLLYSNQSSGDLSATVIINYLAGCRHYGPFTTDYTTAEIFAAIKKYSINYYIAYYSSPYEKEVLLSSALAQGASSVQPDLYPGVIVLGFN